MRIPAEALGPYLSDSERFAEGQKPRPVNELSGLHADLPESLPEYEPNVGTPSAPTQDERRHGRGRDSADPERRQGDDRREKNLPITLDTRTTRGRRQSTSSIDFEI